MMKRLAEDERGLSVLFMVFAVLFLLALIFTTISITDDTLSTTMLRKGTQAKTTSYVTMIVNRTRQCAVDYPRGVSSGTFPRYPEEPLSGDFKDILCPGAPIGSQEMFTGSDGFILPGTPDDIASVTFGNNANGVYFDFAADDPVADWPSNVAEELGQGGEVLTGNTLRAFVFLP